MTSQTESKQQLSLPYHYLSLPWLPAHDPGLYVVPPLTACRLYTISTPGGTPQAAALVRPRGRVVNGVKVPVLSARWPTE